MEEEKKQEYPSRPKINLFTFLDDLCDGKAGILNDENSKEYNIFMVNRFLSMFPDTVFFSNEMNVYPDIGKKEHSLFYIHALTKKKRYIKYFKAVKEEDLGMVSSYYGVSDTKAREYLQILKPEEVEAIRNSMSQII